MTAAIPRRSLALLAASACALAAGGCGGGDADEPRVVSVAPTSTASQPSGGTGRADPDSVEGRVDAALQDWWRQMQYRSADGARRHFTPAVRARLGPRFADRVFQAFGVYAGVRRLMVDEVRSAQPGRATAFLRIRPDGQGDTSIADELAIVRLREIGGRWLLDDTRFFDAQVRAIEQSGRRSDETSPGP